MNVRAIDEHDFRWKSILAFKIQVPFKLYQSLKYRIYDLVPEYEYVVYIMTVSRESFVSLFTIVKESLSFVLNGSARR